MKVLSRQANLENDLPAKFLETLTAEIFPRQNAAPAQKLCFQLRFHPQNFEEQHSQIAQKVKTALNGGFSVDSIAPTVAVVVDKIKQRFAAELEADGVMEGLTGNGRGAPSDANSPWRILYQWLWETEFPRRGWELAKTIATCAMEQLQMKPIEDLRQLDLDEIEACEEVLRVGERYGLEVKLGQTGYLLLVIEGRNGEKVCIAPSRAYALQPQLLPDQSLWLPQPGTPAKSLKFTEACQEYFLVIVTEQPVLLSWVRPDAPARDLALDEARLRELWVQLGKQQQCQVFYKTFVVAD